MKLSGFGKVLVGFYTDRFSIKRKTGKENADGTLGTVVPEIPLYSDIKCRVSFSNTDNPDSGREDSNPISLQIKIFCLPEVDVQKGDILTVDKLNDAGAIMKSYFGRANLPLMYTTHLEILIDNVGDA